MLARSSFIFLKFSLILTVSIYIESPALSAEKYCFEASLSSESQPPLALISTNIDSQKAVVLLNSKATQNEISAREKNDMLETQFVYQSLEPGDCIVTNRNELKKLSVAFDDRIPQKNNETLKEKLSRWKKDLFGQYKTFEEKELLPIVLFRKKDDSKHFGYLELSSLSFLRQDENYREISAETLLNHNRGQKNLLIVYVICPPTRDEVCHLKIKKDGKWVTDPKTNRIFEIPVLARSKRKTGNSEVSYRITPGGDTPQGIYYLWASMFTENPIFGGVPRIDLDAAMPPLNAYPYNLNSYLLSELIPASSFQEYWVNEWPLAYKLGRVFLRVHANTIDEKNPSNYNTPKTQLSYRTTDGCINVGSQMTPLLDRLIDLGVFKKENVLKIEGATSSPLGWKVADQIGKAFLILKDSE